MAVSKEMVERGMRALHEVSTYRGYNQETLDREWSRMERIYRAHVTAILSAALSDQVVVPKAALDWLNGEAPDTEGKWFGECEAAALAAPLAGKYPRTYWWRSKFSSMIKGK